MKTFEVTFTTTITRTYNVEAKSEKEAIEIAEKNADDYFSEEMDENWDAVEE